MEIEFKFCIPPERLAGVKAAVLRGRFEAIRMEARYFDTPDGALSSCGIAFRLRREGDQWVQTVKALGNGPLDRQEHNAARGPATQGAAPEPLPELHTGTVAGTRLLQALQTARGPLTETYGTEMDRITRAVTRQGAVVELALDTGRVVAHRGSPQEQESRICELELELKDGPMASLVALARQWAQRHGLFLSTVSKAERGERLLASSGSHPHRKAARHLSAIDQQLPAGPALQRAVVAHCLQQILWALPATSSMALATMSMCTSCALASAACALPCANWHPWPPAVLTRPGSLRWWWRSSSSATCGTAVK